MWVILVDREKALCFLEQSKHDRNHEPITLGKKSIYSVFWAKLIVWINGKIDDNILSQGAPSPIANPDLSRFWWISTLWELNSQNALGPRLWWKRSILTLLRTHVVSQACFLILPPSQRRAVVTFDPNKPMSLKSNHELPHRMSWITNPPIVCLWGTVPLLLCCGSRTLPFNVKDHESLVPWSHFWKKTYSGAKSSKKVWITKTWRMGPPEKKVKKPRKNTFFFWHYHSPGFSRSKLVSMKSSKTETAAKSEEQKSYATGNDAMSRMFWWTNPPLQCDIWYGSIS